MGKLMVSGMDVPGRPGLMVLASAHLGCGEFLEDNGVVEVEDLDRTGGHDVARCVLGAQGDRHGMAIKEVPNGRRSVMDHIHARQRGQGVRGALHSTSPPHSG